MSKEVQSRLFIREVIGCVLIVAMGLFFVITNRRSLSGILGGLGLALVGSVALVVFHIPWRASRRRERLGGWCESGCRQQRLGLLRGQVPGSGPHGAYPAVFTNTLDHAS